MAPESEDKPAQKSRKSSSPTPTPKRKSVNISLTVESHARGTMHAAALGVTLSSLIEDYLLTLPSYVPVQDKPKKG